jgi:site-specific recombinase XerD
MEVLSMTATRELDLFGQYMRNVKNRSENTIAAYTADIRQFFEIMGDYVSINDIHTLDIETVYITRMVNAGMCAASRRRKISALKEFFAWMHKNGFVVENPVENVEMPKLPHKEPKVMEVEEVRKVIECAKEPDDKKTYFRDLAIISLLFATGMRREEITNVKLCDVNLKESSILVHGKGSKERVVYFNDTARAILSEYISAHRSLLRCAKNSDYLFVPNSNGTNNTKLSKASINAIMNRNMELANLDDKKYTVHSARKAFATRAYENTHDIGAVQKLLGHSSPATTMIYVGISDSAKKKAAMAVDF